MKRYPKYLFYATLLDGLQSWLSSNEIYQEYWGFSEDPAKSEDEFEKEQFQSIINRINRVPMAWEDSEAADRGTAFNEAVDCLIERRKSDKMELKSDKDTNMIVANYNKRDFFFPISLVREFAEYFKGASTQIYTEAILPTKYGDALLYGYIDELLPCSAHDIKTTGKYKVGKFRSNWQHIVYPFCLNANGNDIKDFEYNVAELNRTCSTFTEHYNYMPARDIPRLVLHVERLIEFVEANKHLITDLKIFNQHKNYVTN
jgi:hypothetical protein